MKKFILILLVLISLFILILEFEKITFNIIVLKIISLLFLAMFVKANNYFYTKE